MTIDPRLIGIGAAVLAAILIVFMPVSAHKINQWVISLVLAALIFVSAFSLLDAQLALPAAIGVSLVVLAGRYLARVIRSALWKNLFRYTRRDYWQRKIGQTVISGRRRRRD